MKKFLILALLFCSFSAYAVQNQTVYLPDGTQIIIRENKAYYSCKGKTTFLPDGRYLLSDGSRLTVKRSKVVELDNN